MKNILIFISGFVVGVCTAIVVALYHDIMSMQPQPVVEGVIWDDDLYVDVENGNVRLGHQRDPVEIMYIADKTFTQIAKNFLGLSGYEVVKGNPVEPVVEGLYGGMTEEMRRLDALYSMDRFDALDALDDTQPVYIGDPDDIGGM